MPLPLFIASMDGLFSSFVREIRLQASARQVASLNCISHLKEIFVVKGLAGGGEESVVG